MKSTILALATLLMSLSVHAATIDPNLQATILHPAYGKAAAMAVKASKAAGFNTTALGDTSIVSLTGPRSVLSIPVYSFQVPMGPNSRKLVGYIVSHLVVEPNSPIASCEGVYFKPAEERP
ncbi:MAG TPA: hypothetical protein VFV50_14565 [Bdellovibrionales bacterium]|nr:hypothetical protein [Bdellovibrionales bacterium]